MSSGKTVLELDTVVTSASSDVVAVRQSGDTVDKKATFGQYIDAKVDKVTMVDNAIVRADGTNGDVQGSDVYITDAGNVGIGTTAPSAKLDIIATSGNQLRVGYDSSKQATMAVNSGGTCAISTSGNLNFIVGGSALTFFGVDLRLQNGYSLNWLDSGGSNRPMIELTSADILQIGNTGLDQLTSFVGDGDIIMNGGGDVGIGTATPSEKLHVSGNILADNLTASISYSPAWSGAGTPPSLGNGTFTGSYVKNGNTVSCTGLFATGTTSTYGDSYYTWSVPIATSNAGFLNGLSVGAIVGGVYRAGTTIPISTTTFTVRDNTTGALWGIGAPALWANGDTFNFNLTYRL